MDRSDSNWVVWIEWLSFLFFREIFLAKVCSTFPREVYVTAPGDAPAGMGGAGRIGRGSTLYRVYCIGMRTIRGESAHTASSAGRSLVPSDVVMRFGELTLASPNLPVEVR